MKISVLYHSESGNTEKVAGIIKKGLEKIEGVEARTFAIENPDIDYITASKAVLFGSPIYTGDMSWQMKSFLDKNKEVKLSGKLAAVFATENYIGGGADSALLTLIGHLLVKGMVVYSGGAAEGKPYTHFGAVCIKDGDQDQQQRAEIFGERIAKKAVELFA
ncbi:MAG: flavodoxin family protein [Halanaerobiales bacterium]|nr:flavodoxin family protein [Halanaerobiales bacterium]